MKPKTFILLALLISLAFAQENIFVSPSGTDNTTCGSSQSPCQSIQYAIDRTDNSNIILEAGSTYTLDTPLQFSSKNISLNSTSTSSNTVINATNGLLVISNSTVIVNFVTLNINSFVVDANTSSVYMMNVNIQGSNFDKHLFNMHADNTSQLNSNVISLQQMNFLDQIQSQQSFINANFGNIILTNLTFVKSFKVIEQYPFIFLNQGFFGATYFSFSSLELANSTFLKINNDVFAPNVGNLYTSSSASNIIGASSIFEFLDVSMSLQRISFSGISVVNNNPLFLYSFTKKDQINMIAIGNECAFEAIDSPLFNDDLFTSNNNVQLCITQTNFNGPFSQTLLQFSSASAVNISVSNSYVSSCKNGFIALTQPTNQQHLIKKDLYSHYVSLNSNTFVGNSAKKGSILYGDFNTVPLSLTKSLNTYTNNVASSDGGVFYLSGFNKTEITVASSNEQFTSGNKAGGNGGIYFLSGVSNFTDYLSYHTGSSSQNGGAFYLMSSNLLLTNSNFQSNNALMSGGIGFFDSSDVAMEHVMTNSSSAAVNGGAFFLLGNSTLDFGKGNIIQSATATSGGALFCSSDSFFYGGGNSMFSKCSASKSGGIIYFQDDSKSFIGDVSLYLSNATKGAGIYIETWASVSLNTTSFSGLTASQDGGAIYSAGTLNAISPQFQNCAANRGGALFLTSNIAKTVNGAYFTIDSASKGADLYLDNTYLSAFNLISRNVFFGDKSVYCFNSTFVGTNNNLSGFSCDKCSVTGKNPCPFQLWVWIVIGVGSFVALVVIGGVSFYFYKRSTNNQGYQTIQN